MKGIFKDTDYIYRKLLNNIPQNIFYKNLDSVYILCNKSYASHFNIRPSQIKGKSDFDFFPAELAKKYRADDRKVIQNGKKRELEERYISKGKERIVHTLKAPLRNDRGEIAGIFGIFWDITGFKKAEEALQESEERFRQVAETAGDWIWEVDVTGMYTYASPTVRKILGYKPGEIVGKKHFYDLFVPASKAMLKNKSLEIFSTKKPFKGFINENLHKNGRIVYLETSGLPLLDKTGRLKGYRGTDTDITDRKKAEDDLRELKDNLEIEVKKKTRQLILAHRELENSKRLADIGALAATVAHELRNPLGVIRTAVYNIRQKFKGDLLASHLRNIDKKIAESDVIIKNLLSYSKVAPPRREPLFICGLIQDCVRNFKGKNDASKIKVNIDCACKKRDMVRADPVQMTSLFLNILDNACQSFSGKKGTIDIKVDYNRKKNRLSIRFKDNGSGIPKDDLKKLFEPFFTTKAKGVGLGLAVCKKIVTLHNGTMDISSKKSHGTTVLVRLPIRENKI